MYPIVGPQYPHTLYPHTPPTHLFFSCLSAYLFPLKLYNWMFGQLYCISSNVMHDYDLFAEYTEKIYNLKYRIYLGMFSVSPLVLGPRQVLSPYVDNF